MGEKLMKSEAHFNFHLDGDSSIDAELLSDSIREMANLTKLAAHDVDPEAYVKINVTAFKNGSFEIDFSTICEVVKNLINDFPTVMNTAANIVSVLSGYFKIKKHLAGNNPKKIENADDGNIKVYNENGDAVTVKSLSGNIIQNQTIDQSITNLNMNIHTHNPNGGYYFETSEENLYYPSSAIENMTKPFDIKENDNSKTFTSIVDLEIVKPVLKGNSAWLFIYTDSKGKTRQIAASIKDNKFLETIHSGNVAIRAGSYIKCNLEHSMLIDELGHVLDDSNKYTVLEVIGGVQNNFNNQLSI